MRLTALPRLLVLVTMMDAILAAGSSVALAQPVQLAGTTCTAPPVMHCPDESCPGNVVTDGGPVVEPKTGRTYFLDYPCDLKRNEKVTFILSLHGGGSYGNWQRHYFPIARLQGQASPGDRDAVLASTRVAGGRR